MTSSVALLCPVYINTQGHKSKRTICRFCILTHTKKGKNLQVVLYINSYRKRAKSAVATLSHAINSDTTNPLLNKKKSPKRKIQKKWVLQENTTVALYKLTKYSCTHCLIWVSKRKKKKKILRETLTFIIYYLQRKKQPEPQRLYLLVYTPPAYKVAEWKFWPWSSDPKFFPSLSITVKTKNMKNINPNCQSRN